MGQNGFSAVGSLFSDKLLRACPRIEAVARGNHFESIFWSFEANSYSYLTKMSGKMGRNGFSAVGSLFSDKLPGPDKC